MKHESVAAIDAINVEIFANHFRAIVGEMGWIVQRSAHTTFVKETQDFGTALVTPKGEQFSVLDTTGVTALIGLPLSPFIEAIGDWQPGDVAIANDPYATKGAIMHLSDMFVLKPVFVNEKLFCFTWAFIHCSDVGGSVPGSIDGANREIFQEGLRVSPMKLYRGGQLNQDIVRIICDNCRSPALNWGDLTALVACLDTGEARVKRLVSRYGEEAVEAAMHGTLDRTEALTRSILKKIPTGSYSFTEYLEDDFQSDVPVRLKLRVSPKDDGSVELDLRGSDPQVKSAINMPTCNQKHHPMLSLAVMNFVMTQSQGMYPNSGIVRCIDLVLPEESVVNSSYPAACGMRVITSMRVHDMTLGALSQAMPGLVPAGGAGQLAITSVSFTDHDGNGRVVVANAVEGGSGGGLGLDGISGTDFPAAALRNVPVEILESEAPVLVHRFALRPDSEGAGQYRGGFGIEYAFEVTHPQSVVVTRGKDRHRFSPWGAAGGLAGSTGFSHSQRRGLSDTDLGKRAVHRPRLGEVIVVGGGGGGGYGDPMRRDPEQVRRDVVDGLVSHERARGVYGVVLTAGGLIDEETTTRLRRPDAGTKNLEAFDFGAARSHWEHDWTDAYDAIMNWLEDMPRNGRRDTQERAYHAVRERLSAPYRRSDVVQLLEQLTREWSETSYQPVGSFAP